MTMRRPELQNSCGMAHCKHLTSARHVRAHTAHVHCLFMLHLVVQAPEVAVLEATFMTGAHDGKLCCCVRTRIMQGRSWPAQAKCSIPESLRIDTLCMIAPMSWLHL